MTTVQELLTRLEKLESQLNAHGFSLKQPKECKHGVQDNACIACYIDKTDQTPDDGDLMENDNA